MSERSGPKPTSHVLQRLVASAPADMVSLSWLIDQLGSRAFGFVLLLLGVCGLVPVVSPVAGLLLSIPAFQMIRADSAPVFPQRLAQRLTPTEKVKAVLRRVIPPLHYLERFVRPRWHTPFEATKRVIGGFILALGLCLLIPVPFSNVPVSLNIVLLAFAYLEEDGLLLACAMLIALVLFATAGAAAWGVIAGALWISK